MYSQLESILISYVNTLNEIKNLRPNNSEIRTIISNSAKEIETHGGKVRIVEDNLCLIQVDEKHIRSRL
tara:strand:+ start:141 stop:347 length:207 start_codon:yes stop_codon:yes gene_type:complete